MLKYIEEELKDSKQIIFKDFLEKQKQKIIR